MSDAVTFLRAVVDEVRSKNVLFMAGSIAYSAIVSLLPLALLVLVLASVLGGQRLTNQVMSITARYLTPTGQDVLVDPLTRAFEQAGLSILGLVVLGWGALKLFRSLDTAFSTIYETQPKNDFVNQLRDGILVSVAGSVAVMALALGNVALAIFPTIPFVHLLSPLFLIAALVLVFLPVYYVFPDVDVTLRGTVPGAVVAAVGWVLLEVVFRIYVDVSSTAELYGVIGGVVLFVTWLYFAAFLVLLGAVTNAVLTGRPRRVSRTGAP